MATMIVYSLLFEDAKVIVAHSVSKKFILEGLPDAQMSTRQNYSLNDIHNSVPKSMKY